MTRFLLTLAAIMFASSAAWAAPERQVGSSEAWIGPEYDSFWNAHRSELLQHWQRHSYQPTNAEDCLAVGRVWYCPVRQTLSQRVDESSTTQ